MRRNRSLFAFWLLPLLAVPAHADLIFSEYVEGSSNNKALEIYNPGSSAVDLSNYSVKVYANGRTYAQGAGTTFALTGSVAAGGVHVLAHATLAEKLASGVVQQQVALNFNGNDAVLLVNGSTVVDRIGQVGFDPGTEWAANGASTLDMTLRRQTSVTTGDTAYETAFDPSIQWNASAKDDFTGLGLPGAQTSSGSGSETPVETLTCGGAHTAIADIQGTADISPLEGQIVEVEGVITANYLGTNAFSGFYLQTADSERTQRAHTSEGLFVYAPSLDAASVTAGQRVRVKGTVKDFGGLTELVLSSAVSACATGETAVTPIEVKLPLAEGESFRDYEGMKVNFSQKLYVNDNYYLARYGYVTLAPVLHQMPTQIAAPGTAAAALMASQARERIIFDDGSNKQNPEAVIYPQGGLSAANTLRRGYATGTTGIQGVLEIRNSEWRVQPLPGASVPTFNAENAARQSAPARTSGSDVRVASFNVLNYFNGDGQGGGFPTSRGATTLADFERQRAKIVSAIDGMDADVIGLMEIENDGYGSTSAIQDLVGQLGTNWRFVDPGVSALGTDEITVALIYRSDKVEPVGQAATLAIDDKNRQPLAQTFRAIGGERALTVVVNHLKSKGCSGASGTDADQGDGQSCWNPTRVAAVKKIVEWLKTSPTGVADAGQLIVGDLNSYAQEEPITTFAGSGFANMLLRDAGAQAHSYVYGGEAGNLDHALADSTAAGRILKTQTWSINADEPPGLQYASLYKSAAQIESFYANDAYASSDHDPVIIDLALASTSSGGSDGGSTGGNTDGSNGSNGSDSSSGGGAMGGVLAVLAGVVAVAGLRRRQGHSLRT